MARTAVAVDHQPLHIPMGNEKADFLAKAATKWNLGTLGTLSFNTVKGKIEWALKIASKGNKKIDDSEKSSSWEEIKTGPDNSYAQFGLAPGNKACDSHFNRCKIIKDPANCKLCDTVVRRIWIKRPPLSMSKQ
jgi:hypothetical protein